MMLYQIIYAIIQAATEFLPISSSGHLALASGFFSDSAFDFFVILHLASLIAVLFYTRCEIKELLTFKKKFRKMWLYLIIATIPAALAGFLFRDLIKKTFSSLLFLGIAFAFTGIILFLTKDSKSKSKLGFRSSIFIGLFQIIALFPGISRSGMTISAALFNGIDKERAVKFSFLLYIPLSIGAFILEEKHVGLNNLITFNHLVGFCVCLILSVFFLNLLSVIIKKRKFWVFSIYCWFISLVCFILHFLGM